MCNDFLGSLPYYFLQVHKCQYNCTLLQVSNWMLIRLYMVVTPNFRRLVNEIGFSNQVQEKYNFVKFLHPIIEVTKPDRGSLLFSFARNKTYNIFFSYQDINCLVVIAWYHNMILPYRYNASFKDRTGHWWQHKAFFFLSPYSNI